MIRWPRYPAHEGFVAPARRYSAIWRLIAGLVLATVGYVALNRMFFQVLGDAVLAPESTFFQDLFSGTTPAAMLVLLFTFGFMTLSVAVVTRLLHWRPVRSLIGPIPLAMRQFGAVLAMLTILGVALFILPPWGMGGCFCPELAAGILGSVAPRVAACRIGAGQRRGNPV